MKEALSSAPASGLAPAGTLQAQNSAMRQAMAALAELEAMKAVVSSAGDGGKELAAIKAVSEGTQDEFRDLDTMQEALKAAGGQLAVVDTMKTQNSALRKARSALGDVDALRAALEEAKLKLEELNQLQTIARRAAEEFRDQSWISEAGAAALGSELGVAETFLAQNIGARRAVTLESEVTALRAELDKALLAAQELDRVKLVAKNTQDEFRDENAMREAVSQAGSLLPSVDTMQAQNNALRQAHAEMAELKRKLEEFQNASDESIQLAKIIAMCDRTQQEFHDTPIMKDAAAMSADGKISAVETIQAQNNAVRKAMASEAGTAQAANDNASREAGELARIQQMAKRSQAEFSDMPAMQEAVEMGEIGAVETMMAQNNGVRRLKESLKEMAALKAALEKALSEVDEFKAIQALATQTNEEFKDVQSMQQMKASGQTSAINTIQAMSQAIRKFGGDAAELARIASVAGKTQDEFKSTSEIVTAMSTAVDDKLGAVETLAAQNNSLRKALSELEALKHQTSQQLREIEELKALLAAAGDLKRDLADSVKSLEASQVQCTVTQDALGDMTIQAETLKGETDTLNGELAAIKAVSEGTQDEFRDLNTMQEALKAAGGQLAVVDTMKTQNLALRKARSALGDMESITTGGMSEADMEELIEARVKAKASQGDFANEEPMKGALEGKGINLSAQSVASIISIECCLD